VKRRTIEAVANLQYRGSFASLALFEANMIRQVFFTLIGLICILISAACTPTTPSSTPQQNMANPASAYCEQNGGKLELRPDDTGSVSGLCHFPDGSACDEWTYFRGECRPGRSPTAAKPTLWPTGLIPPPTTQPGLLRVPYAAAGGVMLWTEAQGSRLLATAGNVEQVHISDDGQSVAYLARNPLGAYELYAVNADGSNQRVVAQQSYLQSFQPEQSQITFDFAPASQALYFTTGQYDLHLVYAQAGPPHGLLAAGQGGYFSFSPDGQWMTLYHPNELALTRLSTFETRVAFRFQDDFRSTMGPEVHWKSDSSGFSIVSASGPQGSSDNMSVWFVPLYGQPVKQMPFSGPYGAALSPDGRTVVYLNQQHQPVDVHVIAADGVDTVYGLYAQVDFLGWAPDSRHFVLNLSQDRRLIAPYLCAVGEQPTRLTVKDDALPVVWIDTQRVLFASHGKSLHLQRLGETDVLLDADASAWFDFAIAPR
jgi:putative hemolysin